MATPTTATNAASGADDDATVALTGSGLVFDNTFGQEITAAYKADILDAEHALQAICTNDCDISLNFSVGKTAAGDSAMNNFDNSLTTDVSFSQFLSALKSQSISTAVAQAAVTKLSTMKNPTGGKTLYIPTGLAQILGLASASTPTDDNVILSSSQTWSAASGVIGGQDVIAALEHEISEGALGRVSSLGVYGIGGVAE